MLRLATSIRTKFFLNTLDIPQDDSYEKQIYVKNKSWSPPPASVLIEDNLTLFEKHLRKKQKMLELKHLKNNLKNLTPTQDKTLWLLQNNKNFTIKPTDKNLGPAIMDTNTYITQVLKEHLLTASYRRLTAKEAKDTMDDIKIILTKLIESNRIYLSKAENTYFQRSLQTYHRLPIFYGLPKVHKTPFTLRPVVSGTNSLLAIFSNWLDYKLKELLPYVNSYIKDSSTVIKDLKELHIPYGALLFSADATSMYTNIETPLGIASIQNFISDHRDKLPPNYPAELITQILSIVMNYNVFSFADTFWLQLSGTAMGTPVACAYATITFGHHENTTILMDFRQHLLYYKRYIDDILGIWIPPPRNKNSTWNNFKETLNNWGTLKWVIEEPSKNTHFLDLNINIQGHSIVTETYQKAMNLYLYIPPSSAHPPSCLKGLIAGELRRYWSQNNPVTFQNILVKFIQRLIDRGHTLENLTPLLYQASENLDANPRIQQTNEEQDTLFIHWQFQPHGLQRRDIRRLFDKILKPHLPYNKMQIAITRPKNLKDILTRASLPKHTCIHDLIEQIQGETVTR
jgi:hypothetical protein